jgi:hypothetical protein
VVKADAIIADAVVAGKVVADKVVADAVVTDAVIADAVTDAVIADAVVVAQSSSRCDQPSLMPSSELQSSSPVSLMFITEAVIVSTT